MKKLFAVFMAILLILSISVTTFAVEIDNTNASGNAIATYEANSSFKVTIPTYIAPSGKGETASANMYSVTASDVFIPDGNQLTVTVDYDGVLTDRNGVEIPYKLFSGGSEVTNGQKIIAKDAGNPDDTATVNFSAAVQAEPRYAGTYTDTVKFNISVEERVYSLEEINADEHLYAIGNTKPEYVVAKFNDNYSEVTVLKNGSESDGVMKKWAYGAINPFVKNTKTLKRATIKNGVTSISYSAFNNCISLTSIFIPNSVTEIGGYAFNKCTALTSVTIPDSVTNIGYYAFYGCTSLTNITIPNSITNIESGVFEGCTSLTSVVIPDSVKSIGLYAFDGCTSITNIIIPESVTSIEETAFTNCTSLTAIDVRPQNINYCSENGVLFNRNKTEIICYPAGKTEKSYEIPNSVTSVGRCTFEGCTSLINITIPDGVTSIGGNAFRGCTSLTSIIIPNGVTEIDGHTFYNCTSLTSVAIPESMKIIDSSAFSDCVSLSNITIPNGVTYLGSSAFKNCTSLTNITIPDGVTSISAYAFEGCISLINVTIPNSVTSIDRNAFYNCSSLTGITIPNSILSIGSYAFNNSGLKTIYGVSGSYAETFAAENGYTFIAQG